jgi:hypothetical protein
VFVAQPLETLLCATQEERARLEEENARLAQLDEQERKIHTHHTHIVDQLLTLHCPRTMCNAAFLDFEGCFALQCSQCKCGFCALCLKDCGRDAHAHLPLCEMQDVLAVEAGRGRGGAGGGRLRNGVYGSKEQFDLAQVIKRRTRVHQYLRDTVADRHMQARVVERCRRELADLGLDDIVHEYRMEIAHGVRVGRAAGGGGAAAVVPDQLVALQMQAELWNL